MRLGPEPLPPPLPGALVRAALLARRILLALADRVVPAQVAALEHATGLATTHVLAELARLRIADRLAERPATVEEIARDLGLEPDPLARTLRAAIAIGFFRSDGEGRYHNTRLSRALGGSTNTARAFAEYFGSRSNAAAWLELGDTLRRGGVAFDRVHGASIWDWFEAHSEERENFAEAMASLTALDAPAIATAYPFSEIKTVCDVGGGMGTLLSEILIRHPHLRGALYESAGVLERAADFLRQRGVASRVELIAGSFFEQVPRGFDAYLLKNILHDWDDARSVKVLKNCREAMASPGRVLLLEALVEADRFDFTARSDLQMMIVCGGRERGRAELARLLDEAGFRLGRVFVPATPTAIVEGLT